MSIACVCWPNFDEPILHGGDFRINLSLKTVNLSSSLHEFATQTIRGLVAILRQPESSCNTELLSESFDEI